MIHNYFFGQTDCLEKELPDAKSFVFLSQNGILKYAEKDAPLLATVQSHLKRGIIYGDRLSAVHYILLNDVASAGVDSAQKLGCKLKTVKPGNTTYRCLLDAQSIIETHYLDAIAQLIDSLPDDDDGDYRQVIRIFQQINDNYGVLRLFKPHYRDRFLSWQQKVESYRAFCDKYSHRNVTTTGDKLCFSM